jgi:hypothetical protein
MWPNPTAVVILLTLAGCATSSGYQLAKSEGPCPWTQEQRQVAWENALQALWDWDAENYPYCEESDLVGDRKFEKVGDVCRTFLSCANTGPNGEAKADGGLFAKFDLESRAIVGFSGVVQQFKK